MKTPGRTVLSVDKYVKGPAVSDFRSVTFYLFICLSRKMVVDNIQEKIQCHNQVSFPLLVQKEVEGAMSSLIASIEQK